MRKILLATISVLSLAAVPAYAEPTTFTYTMYAVINLEPVTVTGPPTIPPFDKLVGAGQIDLLNVPDKKAVIAWCLNPLTNFFLKPSGTYDIGPSSGASWNGTNPPVPVADALSHDQRGKIGALMTFADKHLFDNKFESAAIQVAIWDTELNPLGYTFTSLPAVQADVTSLLAFLPSMVEVFNWYTLAPPVGVQNQGVGTLTSVTEPATMAVLGVAFMALGFWNHVRRISKKRCATQLLRSNYRGHDEW